MRTPSFPMLVLAALFLSLMQPALARAQWEACQKEASASCKGVKLTGVLNCLVTRWGSLSPACRKEAAVQPDMPCAALVRARCLNSPQGQALSDCVRPYQNKDCKVEVFETAGRGPCYQLVAKYCPKMKMGREMINCLMSHVEDADINPLCMEYLSQSPDWPRPCQKDGQVLCPGPKDNRAQGFCLWKNLKRLGRDCRRMIMWNEARYPCRDDAAALCADVSEKKQRSCLNAQVDDLSEACRKAVRDGGELGIQLPLMSSPPAASGR